MSTTILSSMSSSSPSPPPPPHPLFRTDSVEFLIPGPHSTSRHSTLSSSVFSLVSTIIGGGVLSLPYAFSHTGILLGIILLLLIAMASDFSIYILISCSRRIRQGTSYESIGEYTYGKGMKLLCLLLLSILIYIAIIAYLILMRDLTIPLIHYIFHLSDTYNAIMPYEIPIVVGALSILLLPLCCMESIHSLRFSSFISVISMVLLATAITIRSIQHTFFYSVSSSSSPSLPSSSLSLSPSQPLSPLLWVNFSPSSSLYAFPIMAVAYLCHFNVLPVHSDLIKPSRQRIKKFIHLVILLVTGIYMLVGVAGYAYSRNDTKGNILNNFSSHDSLITMGRIGLLFTIVMSFPLLVLPMREVGRKVMDEMVDMMNRWIFKEEYEEMEGWKKKQKKYQNSQNNQNNESENGNADQSNGKDHAADDENDDDDLLVEGVSNSSPTKAVNPTTSSPIIPRATYKLNSPVVSKPISSSTSSSFPSYSSSVSSSSSTVSWWEKLLGMGKKGKGKNGNDEKGNVSGDKEDDGNDDEGEEDDLEESDEEEEREKIQRHSNGNIQRHSPGSPSMSSMRSSSPTATSSSPTASSPLLRTSSPSSRSYHSTSTTSSSPSPPPPLPLSSPTSSSPSRTPLGLQPISVNFPVVMNPNGNIQHSPTDILLSPLSPSPLLVTHSTLSPSPSSTLLHRLPSTIFIVFSASFLSMFITSVATLWSIVGSSVSILIAYILPSIFYLKIRRNKAMNMRKVGAMALLAFGIMAWVGCTYVAIMAIIYPEGVEEIQGGGGNGVGESIGGGSGSGNGKGRRGMP